MADEKLNAYQVTEGNFVTDHEGQKGAGGIVHFTADEAKPLKAGKFIQAPDKD